MKPALLTCILAVLAAGGAARVAGQNSAAEQSCLYMGDVRRTTILDDNNILFYMRNGTIYQNRLRNTCYMLRSDDRFTYGSSPLRRLCAGDLISPVPDSTFSGVPFPTSSCNLGSYLAIDKEVADDLVATSRGKKSKEARTRQVLKTQPVELPPAAQPAELGASSAATPAAPSPPQPTPAPDAPATSPPQP